MTDIYCDESKGGNSSCQILTIIWGETRHCEAFHREVKDAILESPHLFPTKVFHASKVKSVQWPKRIWSFRWLLAKLSEYVSEGKLSLVTHFESKEKIGRNADHLFGIMDRAMSDPTHQLARIFQDIPDEVKPVITHRTRQLYYLLKFRDRFGSYGEYFNFHPDSSGKVLRHLKDQYFVHGNVFSTQRGMIDILTRVGNAFIEALDNPTARDSEFKKNLTNQRLNNFAPMKDEESYLIQASDVISNFWYGALLGAFGKQGPGYELKANEVMKWVDSSTFRAIKDEFTLVDSDLVPKPTLKGILEYLCI